MQMGNGLAALVAPALLRLRGHTWCDALRVGIAAGGGWQLAKAVKRLVPRERPTRVLTDVVLRDGDPDGRGFVSGHATVAMALAVSVGPLVDARTRTVLLGAATTAGLARVHVGAHLPLDVVGGLALGMWWAAAVAGASAGSTGSAFDRCRVRTLRARRGVRGGRVRCLTK
jgi:undecaprenyl-diphosphatase